MGFRNSKATTPAIPASEPAATPAESLRPDTRAEQAVEDKGADLLDHARASARVQALRTMNAVRTLSPILALACAADGLDNKQQAKLFIGMLNRSTQLAERAAARLGLDPKSDRWAVNTLERGFAQVLAANQKVSDDLADVMADRLPAHAFDVGERAPGISEMHEDAVVGVSLLQAMMPVAAAQQKFSFLRTDRDKDLVEMKTLLVEEVMESMQVLLSPIASAFERKTMFGLLCQEAGRVMASSWDHEAELARQVLSKKTRAQVEAWKAANPSGLPIKSVGTRFSSFMKRLRRLSRQQSS